MKLDKIRALSAHPVVLLLLERSFVRAKDRIECSNLWMDGVCADQVTSLLIPIWLYHQRAMGLTIASLLCTCAVVKVKCVRLLARVSSLITTAMNTVASTLAGPSSRPREHASAMECSLLPKYAMTPVEVRLLWSIAMMMETS